MSKLHIADGLSLPVDAVTQAIAFLGRRGSGKSYAASKLCEEMLKADAQVVVLDYVGVWHGLRLAADGKGHGFKIPLFGGLHGDVPLQPEAGALVADLVVDRHLSAVLDVSQFIASEQARFACDFATRFFQRKKASPSAVHLFIEECQEAVPQNIAKGEAFAARTLHAFERLVKLGRNFGIGVSLISQRPQEVNKKALNQTELLFAFQMTGPQERDAVRKWVADKGGDENVYDLLPRLEVGCPHVWSPQWLRVSKEVRIARKLTYDASSTPTVGAKPAKPKELTPVDVAEIKSAMSELVEKSKADDPRELRKIVSDLQRQLRERPAAEAQVIEVPVLKNGQLDKSHKLADRLEGAMAAMGEIVGSLSQAIGRATKPAAPARPVAMASRPVPQPSVSVPLRPPPMTNRLPVGEAKILTALIQYPDGLRREQLTVLTGYKRSSRDAYIQRLREKEYVEVVQDRCFATEGGMAALPDAEPLPTGAALRDYWVMRLPQGERVILVALLESYPIAHRRDDLDASTGYKRSSRDAYIARLMAKELVVESGRGEVRASDTLFQE